MIDERGGAQHRLPRPGVTRSILLDRRLTALVRLFVIGRISLQNGRAKLLGLRAASGRWRVGQSCVQHPLDLIRERWVRFAEIIDVARAGECSVAGGYRARHAAGIWNR